LISELEENEAEFKRAKSAGLTTASSRGPWFPVVREHRCFRSHLIFYPA
jgi:hypothetical protein